MWNSILKTWTLAFTSHTLQVLILVDWPSHQECAVKAIVLTCSKWWERQRHSLQHSNSKKKRFTAFPELHMLIFFIKLHLYSLFFANLFYYSTYFYYYPWALLHLLVLFIGPAILFQPSFTFIYNIFSKKNLISAK